VAIAAKGPFAVLFVNHKHSSAFHGARRFEQKALEAAVLDYLKDACCRCAFSITFLPANLRMASSLADPVSSARS
jgi:hypothetical protein